jgi:glutamyl endopeptidase
MSSRRCLAVIVVLAALVGPAGTAPPAASTPEAIRAGDTLTLVSNRRGAVTIPLRAPRIGDLWMSPSNRGTDPANGQNPTRGRVAPVDPEATVPRQGPTTRSVIGADDRRLLTATTVYPNRAIAHLTMDLSPNGDAGSYLCTGFLIDRNTLLTSGHCVHDGGTGSTADFATNMTITLGRGRGGNPNAAPYGTCRAGELLTTPEWIDAAGEGQDYGIVQLTNCTVPDVGRRTGWFGYVAVQGRSTLAFTPANVRGYPGLPPRGLNGTLWTHNGQVLHSSWAMAFYRTDTTGGESGSPVYQPGRPWCGACALAIHGYGAGHGVFPHTTLNHGPRITVARFQAIRDVAGANG